jgi:hypothetical protein
VEYFLQHLDKLFAPLFLFFISLNARFLLEKSDQNWIKTFSHTVTIFIIPLITYVITSVISGNIALSLGMVGALSIVRFRNPVRSPLELTLYFGLITFGIAASVSLKWLIYFYVLVLLFIILLYIFNKFFTNYLQSPFFTSSFSEGNTTNTLFIVSKKELDLKQFDSLLKNIRYSNESMSYIYASTNPKDLIQIKNRLKGDKSIISFELNNN